MFGGIEGSTNNRGNDLEQRTFPVCKVALSNYRFCIDWPFLANANQNVQNNSCAVHRTKASQHNPFAAMCLCMAKTHRYYLLTSVATTTLSGAKHP